VTVNGAVTRARWDESEDLEIDRMRLTK